jgi:hypothetical protein
VAHKGIAISAVNLVDILGLGVSSH